MAVSSNYTTSYTKDIVTVSAVGAKGATCKTSFGAEISVLWGANLPSPVPQIGERWYVERVGTDRWSFTAKITGKSYSLMKCSMQLDMASCISRERSTVDDIANGNVSEVYLTVAEGGVVYWASDVAKGYGLSTCDVDGKPFDYVEQVVRRCVDANLSVVFVIDCNLWSDISDKTHNYYQQVRMPEEFAGTMGWYQILKNVWDDINNYSWGQVREVGMTHIENAEHVATWSFLTAKEPVKSLVMELYDKYGETVRGVCFRNWCIDGAYADVSDYMGHEFLKENSGTLVGAVGGDLFSDYWWERRDVVHEFYMGLQREFVANIKKEVGNWPVSVIVPSRALCLSSDRVGALETWLYDDFSTIGWSKVGCYLDYSKSVDRAVELRSFEYLVANLIRFSGNSTPLFIVDVMSSDDYDGMFDVLSKYNVTNVLLNDYEHWRLLSDHQVITLKDSINAASVTPLTVLSEIGVCISTNSREVAYYDEFDVNRFARSAQDFCMTLLDKLPHRLRVLYDSDLEDGKLFDGVSALVLYHVKNMSDDAITQVGLLFDRNNVVVVGRCGMYPMFSTMRRNDIPFLDKFGEVDYETLAYETQMTVKGGRIGAFDSVYIMSRECPGIGLTRHTDPNASNVDAIGYDSEGHKVVAPVFFKGRSSIASVDILDEPVLLEMASEMTLRAIGRDR